MQIIKFLNEELKYIKMLSLKIMDFNSYSDINESAMEKEKFDIKNIFLSTMGQTIFKKLKNFILDAKDKVILVPDKYEFYTRFLVSGKGNIIKYYNYFVCPDKLENKTGDETVYTLVNPQHQIDSDFAKRFYSSNYSGLGDLILFK